MEPVTRPFGGRSEDQQDEYERLVQSMEFRVRVLVGVNRALHSEYLDDDGD